MQLISIIEKSGFRAKNGNICILDKNLQPFYIWEGKPGFLFNLPAGNYWTDSDIERAKRPKKFSIPALPRPERKNAKLPADLKIVIGENPHKASVWTGKNVVLLDKSLFEIHPKPRLVYIFLHELGHYFYSTEWKADLFAAVYMLKKGYNPSQVFDASRNSLSKKNYARIEKTFKHLQKNVN